MKNFSSGIHALVSKNNKCLLIKRNDNDEHDPKHWDLPGGGIDFGEEPLDAIVRETKEETGIDITAGKILYVCGILCDDTWSIDIYIEGIYKSGEIILSEEHSSFIWVTKEELQIIKPKSAHLQNVLKGGLFL